MIERQESDEITELITAVFNRYPGIHLSVKTIRMTIYRQFNQEVSAQKITSRLTYFDCDIVECAIKEGRSHKRRYRLLEKS